ncbi:hypothetical protein P9272_03835 [Mesorhizobium sp. WSM4976]|uniref:hypothetical protein n=1 Tax=Mesorhizobium sp. WSM4976 TaxID=3038549 RepID=UPI00241666A6|nr:hypothetical protein [Mesorhizobium sp. WSM4976]MDG4892716.1 hypothetical protein [Mesorhizobium sp. WSM4976]
MQATFLKPISSQESVGNDAREKIDPARRIGKFYIMGRVISIVEGDVALEQIPALIEAYKNLIDSGLPPSIVQSFLVQRSHDHVAIITVWRTREDLQAMIDSGGEPVARRLIREAGGQPQANFHDVLIAG